MSLGGRVIKHENFMDVAFLVHKSWDEGNKIVLKGEWINQGYVESFPLQISEIIKIEKINLSQWLYSVDSDQRCIRDLQWKRVNHITEGAK